MSQKYNYAILSGQPSQEDLDRMAEVGAQHVVTPFGYWIVIMELAKITQPLIDELHAHVNYLAVQDRAPDGIQGIQWVEAHDGGPEIRHTILDGNGYVP